MGLRNILIIGLTTVAFLNKSIAGTFTSNVASGPWNDPASWIVVGDADGIPDSNDDITILSGHTIIWSSNSQCRDLTVDFGGIFRNSFGTAVISISGDYEVNGTETGAGFYTFTGNGSNIGGTGSFSNNTKWSFVTNRTIASTVTTSKNSWTRIYNGITVTNFGNITLLHLISNSGTGFWVNGTNANLVLTSGNITVSLDASSFTNTVQIKPKSSVLTVNNMILNNTFHHLQIQASSYNTLLSQDLIINGNLTIDNGGRLDLNGRNINIRGDFSNSGLFTITTGTIMTLDGSSTQTFSSNRFPTALQNLVVNNASGVNTGGAGTFTIANSLTVLDGNFNVGTNKITLLSDATSTAYIGESNGTFSGSMNIRRFITARNDGFSDMSSPISNGTFAQLSDDFATLYIPYVPNSSAPSAWGYDESIWDYVAIETSGTAMVPGVGYEVYLDNDGDENTTFSATTVDFSGTPNIGNIDVDVTADNDGWNLIGNPYASHINYDTWYDDNDPFGLSMGADFMYYDETADGGEGDFVFGFYGDGEELAAGQGFWIETFVANTVTFSENQKTTTTSSSTFRQANRELFGLKVKSADIKYSSHTYFRFDNNGKIGYEQGVDKSFLKVPAEEAPSLFTIADNKKLKLNHLYPENSISIPVFFKAGKNANYTIAAVDIAAVFDAGYTKIVLEDLFNGNLYDLTNGEYSFEGKTSDDQNRFVLHLGSENDEISYENQVSFVNSNSGVFVNFNYETNNNALIDVFNVAGQELTESIKVTTDNKTVGLHLPQDYQGMYIIRVIIDEKVITQRFYKN